MNRPIPDIGDDADVHMAIRNFGALMEQRIQNAGGDLAALAVVWVVAEGEAGNSCHMIIAGDDSNDVRDHMADCIMGGDDFHTTPLTIPQAN